MRAPLVAAALLLLAAAPPHHRAAPGPAGHYRLAGGPDVASEILLRADGRFQFFLMEGAVDEQAQGRWTREGSRIKLVTLPKPVPPVFSAGPTTKTRGDAAQAPGHLAGRARHRHDRPARRLR